MNLSTQPYKGARDFYPGDKRLQNYMFSVMRSVVESYGYEEYDAPILEPLELYLSKTSEEIVSQQTYSFEDRGGRKVTLRPEMTPTVSRMVAAKRQELAYPLRWYSIPVNWRYERPQHGRLREFWQLNVDLFGIEGLAAEVEMIQIADDIMKAYGAKPEMYEIRINSRKLLNKRIDAASPRVEANEVVRLIDGFEKLSKEDFMKKLSEVVDKPDALYEFLSSDGDSEELKDLRDKCGALGVSVVVNHSLARGFDYYTDIVFEVFDKHPDNNRSMFGGGRYDGLVGLFGVGPVPTVGFGMGDVTLQDFLTAHKLLPKLTTETDLYIAILGDITDEAQPMVKQLRDGGLNVAVDFSGRKLDKQIKSALKKGINHVAFIGQHELSDDKLNLKDLLSGEEQLVDVKHTISIIKTSK